MNRVWRVGGVWGSPPHVSTTRWCGWELTQCGHEVGQINYVGFEGSQPVERLIAASETHPWASALGEILAVYASVSPSTSCDTSCQVE